MLINLKKIRKKKASFFQENAINKAFYAQFDCLQLRRRDINEIYVTSVSN